MKRKWFQVTCQVPAGLVDTLAEYMIELSNNGVAIDNLRLDTFSLDSLEESPVKTVTAFFADDVSVNGGIRAIESYLIEITKGYSDFEYAPPAVSSITEEDWSSNWKEHFKPLRVGSRLVIKPTWESFPESADDIILELDPGMAFGTGAHPTTLLCLSMLEKYLTSAMNSEAKTLSALDVGTGSGILSIAAVKLGVARVTAIDIDPEAVRVAEENCVLNKVDSAVSVSDTPLQVVQGRYDIVLANILAEELVRMAPELVRRMAPGGTLILSGILLEKEDLVLNGFAGFAVTLSEVVREQEWSCIVFRGEG